MRDADDEFRHLAQTERDACARSERLSSTRFGMLDEGVRRAARKICDDAREALERFFRKYPGEAWRKASSGMTHKNNRS
jgi:hypothetical protein